MKILLLNSHSRNSLSEETARISANNHWEYSAKHAYDSLVLRYEFEEALNTGLRRILDLLDLYEVILVVGADVLFGNFDIGVENILLPDDNIVMASETKGWPSKFNNGVMILCNTNKTMRLLTTLMEKKSEWTTLRLFMQSWLNQNYENPVVKEAIRLVPTRTMNSTYKKGEEDWQPGDWIVHFYGHPHEEKPELMLEFLGAK